MGTAYYNEIDPFCAEWLRNLIREGRIAPGDVDERDIRDVPPDDLAGYAQCHFFAGIGGWSRALRLAGWPDDKPVWTGSCPCQPFSAAGQRAGFADERHLWPHFHWLIAQRRPAIVFGEQVASKDGLGWLDLVQADLEGADYASAAIDLCAAGVGAPHIRQRLYFVADGQSGGRNGGTIPRAQGEAQRSLWRRADGSWLGGEARELAHPDGVGARADAEALCARQPELSGVRDVGDADDARLEGRQLSAERFGERAARPSGVAGHWADTEWIACRDGKLRAVEPGTFPLAHGATARVGRLRAYGNAIVPQVASAFIGAFMGSRR